MTKFIRPDHPLGTPNLVDDRAAMGLPPWYTPSRLEHLYRRIEEFIGLGEERLVEIVEDAEAPLDDRITAATRLAFLGDPRLKIFDPAMVDIPGGITKVGLSPESLDRVTAELADLLVEREWIEKETPSFVVNLEPYRIGRYPVTNQEYRVFLQETRYPELPTSWTLGRFPIHMANHPVYTVSALAADAYACWLSERVGRTFALPSEVEWETAASGRTDRAFPWGDKFGCDRANTLECGLLMSTPVGTFPNGRSPYGIDDMAGNVEEYVADTYAPYPGGKLVQDDLSTVLGGEYRVTRGGSFARFRDLARCRRRHGPYNRSIYVVGFRIVERIRR